MEVLLPEERLVIQPQVRSLDIQIEKVERSLRDLIARDLSDAAAAYLKTCSTESTSGCV